MASVRGKYKTRPAWSFEPVRNIAGAARQPSYFCYIGLQLRYKIQDSAGSPYAELILMANSVGTGSMGSVQPYLTWPQDLSIDNTNGLTFGADFVQQKGMTDRNMQISRPLRAEESESVYFFKADVSKNYSKQRTIVNKNVEGNYVIPVEKLSD